jgi:curli biogenesis system outer membrane secretion channel CsgG
MKRLLRILAFPAAIFFLAAACGPNIAKVQDKVSHFSKKRIGVLPFIDAPGDPNSGELAADLFCEQLRKAGFILVNRTDVEKLASELTLQSSGIVKPEDAARLGQMLGADALLSGAVTEAAVRREFRSAVYETQNIVRSNPDGTVISVPVQVVVRPEENIVNAVFSFTTRFTFVEDGSIAWTGSGSGQAEYGTVQQAAETAVKKTADKLFTDILKDTGTGTVP